MVEVELAEDLGADLLQPLERLLVEGGLAVWKHAALGPRWRGGTVRSGDHVSTWGFGRPGWLLYAPRGPAGKTSWAGTRPRESLAMGKAVNYATRLVEPAFNAVEVVEIVGVVSPEDCVSDMVGELDYP